MSGASENLGERVSERASEPDVKYFNFKTLLDFHFSSRDAPTVREQKKKKSDWDRDRFRPLFVPISQESLSLSHSVSERLITR